MGTIRVSEACATPKAGAVRKPHDHDLRCEQGPDFVVGRILEIADSVKYLGYRYTLHANNEVPANLGDIFSSRPHALDI